MASISISQEQNKTGEKSTSYINSDRMIVGLHLLIAFAALSIGILLGPAQAYRRAPALQWEIPVFTYYYQALTLHGVLNALVFTTYFIMGSSYFIVQRSLKRSLKFMNVAWTSFGMMTLGVVLAAYAMLSGQANVLYTFYPPLEAHWTFYLGLALVVVGTWVGAAVVFINYALWKRENPNTAVPLGVFAVLANFVMWISASLGVAIEVLTIMLPLSLGLIDTIDPQVARIFFWFFGHPLVYFWLIPAYASWYAMLPKQLGVKLFSDSFGRIAFLMIMIFSIPIGVHHLFVDPGVSETAKIMHSILTFVVAVPSFLTAFNLAATLERSGRKHGAEGLLDWLWKQPWGNPVIVSQFGGMILFLFGGVTGLMNASFNMNVALHNTSWVVGHFHTTLGGAVFMTYIGMTYWMLPQLRGRKLFAPKLALAQAYLWLFGMLVFAGGMGRAGIEGAVRRSDLGAVGAYVPAAAAEWLNLSAIGGTLLLLSSICLYVVLIGTLFFSKEKQEDEVQIVTEAPKDEHTPKIFENWTLWIAVIIISNIIMWGPVLLSAFNWELGFWVLGQPSIAR